MFGVAAREQRVDAAADAVDDDHGSSVTTAPATALSGRRARVPGHPDIMPCGSMSV
jgi:hypothetical protein